MSSESQNTFCPPRIGTPTFLFRSRPYSTDVITKSPFEANILRILCSEIDYQSDYAPPHQPATKFNSFAVEDRAGEQWMTMNGKFRDSEDIKIEATMFDGFVSIPRVGDDATDTLEIHNVYVFSTTSRDNKLVRPYIGPHFGKLSGELRRALHEFLKARGPSETFKSFNVDFHPGEYKITPNKRFEDNEHIRIEVVRYRFTRQTEPPDIMYSRYRIYFDVYISKEDCPDELKLVCEFEDECCLDIQRVYMASCDNKLPSNYRGPIICRLFSSDRWLELRRTFEEFLKARGVNPEEYYKTYIIGQEEGVRDEDKCEMFVCVEVSKDGSSDALRIAGTFHKPGNLEIEHVYVPSRDKLLAFPYTGPPFYEYDYITN
ncbi:hypothetical protein LWI28_026824 [Acer negundo]|uniref:Uncharacterized protein n=1 Tax=Acer negundo TaxID=4023 RepID=A0AAD5NYR1_ACENE|nr:hypothetical protein LWI28_026824 [Acer negundo]